MISIRIDSTPNPERDLGFATNRVARLLRQRMSRNLVPLGLTAQQAAVIQCIRSLGAPSPSAVADRVGVDRPTMTGIAERLGRDGWIESGPNPADGRSRVLRLTAHAVDALPLLDEASAQVGRDAVHNLTFGQAATLLQLLGTVAVSLEAEDDADA